MPFISLYYLIALPKTFSTMLNKGSVSWQLHLVPDVRGKALNLLPLSIILAVGFSGGSDGKESTCNSGDLGSIPGLGRSPGGRHGNVLQYSCLKNPHRQRGLVGYSLWGITNTHTESPAGYLSLVK